MVMDLGLFPSAPGGISPLFKWAGGKRRVVELLKQFIPKHYKRYYEPFLGGGALWLSLLPKCATVSDINPQVVNVYGQVRDNFYWLVKAINALDSVKTTKESYAENRAEYNKRILAGECSVETAALFLWLTKRCFNGVYRTNAKGEFNMPFNEHVIPSISLDITTAEELNVYLNDKRQTMLMLVSDYKDVLQNVEEGDLVYIDSPYIPASNTASFTDYSKEKFGSDEHRQLAAMVQHLDEIGAHVIVSNNDTPLTRELYEGFNFHSFNISRSVSCKGSTRGKENWKEVIITNGKG